MFTREQLEELLARWFHNHLDWVVDRDQNEYNWMVLSTPTFFKEVRVYDLFLYFQRLVKQVTDTSIATSGQLDTRTLPPVCCKQRWS